MQHFIDSLDPLAIGSIVGGLALLAVLAKVLWDDIDLTPPTDPEDSLRPDPAGRDASTPETSDPVPPVPVGVQAGSVGPVPRFPSHRPMKKSPGGTGRSTAESESESKSTPLGGKR